MTNRARPQCVWITGAGKGIGRAVALRLAEQGATVIASARTEEDLQMLANAAPAGKIRPFPLDITYASEVESSIARMEREVGAIDLAILNAGTYMPMTAETFSASRFSEQINVNLNGTANCLAPLMQRMIARRKGHIAVVASVAGYRGLPTASAYGASKAALINMCEALQPELARHQIKLTLINPGFVETPLTAKNNFPMPFLVSAEKAADYIVKGLAANTFEVAFPRRFAFLMGLLKWLPDRLFFALIRRQMK